MAVEFRLCEAPEHQPSCNGIGSTKDHFTSKAIAKALGWKPKRVHDPLNLQYLSVACHREKDKHNSQIAEQVKFQVRGGEIKLGEAIV